MDGCTSWGLYWHVVLPALRPAMAVLGLLTWITGALAGLSTLLPRGAIESAR